MFRLPYIILSVCFVLFILLGCGDHSSSSDNSEGQTLDDGLFYHLFYLDRSGAFIRWDQWDGRLQNFVQSSEIPLQSAGQPVGGVQLDPLDTDVLQARADMGNFIFRTRYEPPLMELMETEEQDLPGSYFYLFLAETGEFRELYRSSSSATIGKFLYSGSDIYFEEIYQNGYKFKRLDLSLTPPAEYTLITSGTEIVSMALNQQMLPVVLLQDQDQIYQYRFDADSMVMYGSYPQPRRGRFLPPVTSDEDGIALALLPEKKRSFHAVYLLTFGKEQMTILPEAPQAVQYAGNQEWLILGQESMIHLNSNGDFLHQYCLQEPVFIGKYQHDVFIRSVDYTLKINISNKHIDTLNPALHDVFFDLLSLRKGPGGYRKS